MKLNDQLYLKLKVYSNQVKLGEITNAQQTHEDIIDLMQKLGE